MNKNFFILSSLYLIGACGCKKNVHSGAQITAPAVQVSALAGNGMASFADGMGSVARFKQPNGVAVDRKGYIYVTDNANNRIQMITPDGTTTTLAGRYVAAYADGPGNIALFDHPFGIAVDGPGNPYRGDLLNIRIRKIMMK